MSGTTWAELAMNVADYAQRHLATIRRGALTVQGLDRGNELVAVFGNDNYAAEEAVRRQVAHMRSKLQEMPLQELAFELSPNGLTWCLLVFLNQNRYHTAAGRAFQAEIINLFLQDAIQESFESADTEEESRV